MQEQEDQNKIQKITEETVSKIIENNPKESDLLKNQNISVHRPGSHGHTHAHEETASHSQPRPQLSSKEMTSLKKNKYHEAISKFKLSHVILNKKTGVIVEMKAASATHACNMIGWKVNHCKLLSVIDREAENKKAQEAKETQEDQEIKEIKETSEPINAKE